MILKVASGEGMLPSVTRLRGSRAGRLGMAERRISLLWLQAWKQDRQRDLEYSGEVREFIIPYGHQPRLDA